MPRANRYMLPGYAYHLTHRCHNRSFLDQSIAEALERRELAREPVWTESVAVGSQPFVKKVSEETQNRVALESQESQPGMWTVREPDCAYA
jgi:hypothetical protein